MAGHTQPQSYYEELARAAAIRAGIDPDIFHAQINLESGFSPSQESYAGAQGIAQIIPRFHPGVDPWDPEAALNYAANLISGYLTNYGGDIRKALTAYHAGSGTLASAVRLGGVNWEQFMLQGAQEHFGDSTAQRVARDNENYLRIILGGSGVFHLATPKLRVSRPGRPDVILEGEEARTFNFSKSFRERLANIYANVFGKPAGEIAGEPFPGYNTLIQPFVSEFESTLLGLNFIQSEIERLNSEATGPLSTRVESNLPSYPIIGPSSILINLAIPFLSGIPGAIRGDIDSRNEAINKQLAIRQQINDALLTKYGDLILLLELVKAQVIAFQELDPDIRATIQASEVDSRLAQLTPQQLEVIQPLIDTIKEYYEEPINQLATMTEDEIVASIEIDLEEVLFTAPTGRPIASYLLTVDEMRISLRGGATPFGPSEDMTGEEIRKLLQLQGLDDEEILEYQQDVAGTVSDLLTRADEIVANIEALKAGSGDWILPRPGIAEYLKASAIQPLLVASVALEKYQNFIVRPIAGGGILLASYLNPGEDGIERDFKEALKEENWWKALATAERKNDFNPIAKFAIETLADPATYIGWGIATKLVRPLPIIGVRLSSIVATAEHGYIKMANAPFTAAFKALGAIPKPASTIANLNRIQTAAVVDKFLTKFYKKKVSQVTSSETTAALGRALEKEAKFPYILQDEGVMMGKILKALPTPTADDISIMSQRAGGSLTKESVISSKTLMLNIDHELAKAVNDPRESNLVARSLLTLLQIEDNDAGKKATQLIVSQRIAGANSQAQRLITGSRTGEIIENISQNVFKVSMENNTSQAAIQAGQLGKLSYPLKRVAGGLGTIWGNSIERFMIVPLARAYLLFPMYQTWNVVETMGKILFAGKNPIIKGNAAMRARDTWADVGEGRIMEVLGGRGRGLVGGERVGDLGKAKTALGKVYESVRRAFGESLAVPFQANSQAGFVDQVALDNLQRLRPTEWKAINKILRVVGTDFEFLPKELRGEARDLIISAITRGPNAIRALSDDFTIDRLRTFKVHELVAKYDHIDSPIQDFIVEAAETGRLWSATDDVIKEVDELIWYKYLTSPEHFALNFEAMIDEIATAPITSWDDIAKRLIALQTANRTYGDLPLRQYNIVKESLKNVVDFRERDRIFDLYFSQMEIFSEKVNKGLTRYTTALQRHTEVSGNKALDLEVLMGKYKLQQEMVSETFAKVAIIRDQIFKSGKRPKGNEEWLEAFAKLGKPWQELPKAKESINRQIFLAEAKLGGLDKHRVPNTLRPGVLGRISRTDIAALYGIEPDDVMAKAYLPDFQVLAGKDDFTSEVMNRVAYNLESGEEAALLGWTNKRIGEVWDDIMREFRLDPRNISAIAPARMQFEAMTKEIMSAKMTIELPDAAKSGFAKWTDDLANQLEGVGGYWDKGIAGEAGNLSPSWLAGKKQALSEASDEFFQTFPDYLNLTYLDVIMRSQMPYWTYEFHRLFYLPRQFMRTPGLITGLGRYNEYSDGDNYFHVPFSSLEINPLRGTILMGGLRRLTLRDYPEFYDTFPGFQQALDVTGRFGFYPGAHVTFANILFGSSSPRWDQVGEMVPVAAKAPIQGFRAFAQATGNETLITASERLANVFIPERFRDYMIGLGVSDIGAVDPETGKPINGADLIGKRIAGTPLTEFEEDLWTQATGELSVTFLLMDQTGLFRFRPEEKQKALDAYSEIVSEYTGISREQLDYLNRWGYKWQDIVPPNAEMRDLLNTTEFLQKWAGSTAFLHGASEQSFRARRNEFWDEVDDLQLDLRVQQESLDCQFGFPGATSCDNPNTITSDDWTKLHGGLGADYRSGFDSIRGLDRYKDIPVTREEVLAFFKKTGQALPIEHPEVELLRMFYDIQVEDKFDPNTGKVEKDWFTFFAKREMLLQAAGDFRGELESIIDRNETPLEKLWNHTYQQFLKPYYNRADLTISRFTPEQQTIIYQWIASDNPLDRGVLQDIKQQDGTSLIGQYQTDLKVSGRQFRFYSPNTDAWLAFWGITGSFRTVRGQDKYKELLSTYRPNYESVPGLELPNE